MSLDPREEASVESSMAEGFHGEYRAMLATLPAGLEVPPDLTDLLRGAYRLGFLAGVKWCLEWEASGK